MSTTSRTMTRARSMVIGNGSLRAGSGLQAMTCSCPEAMRFLPSEPRVAKIRTV